MNNLFKSAFALGLVALVGTMLLTGVDWLTADRIAQQEKRVVLQQLGQILPSGYDNELLEDRFTLVDESHFPNGQEVTVWRARQAGNPLAAILKFNAVDGYNGNITLMAGINMDGSLRGVRVLSHKETPGLGDEIEAGKSDWILKFSGKSLENPGPDKWRVKREGGAFDQFTGATITPRAVVEAVRLALVYFDTHRALLFETPSQADEDSAP